MRDGPPELYRMQRCRNCPLHCKPCLTLEEAKQVQVLRVEAHESKEAWKSDTICDACHKKSNRRQNEIIAEKAGHGKPKGKLAKIQALLDALDECEKQGVILSEQELSQLQAAMAALGI